MLDAICPRRQQNPVHPCASHRPWNEAALFAGAALSGWLVLSWPREPLHWLGLALYVFALLFYPLLAVIFGRGWSQSEVFGLAPDPTVLATLGLLLTATRATLLLMPIPLLWSVTASLTLYAMDAPEAWIMGAATALAVFATGYRMTLKSD